ncbi:ATP-dependent DNA helicase [Fructilactobacillus lindneri]|uniref:UvrD-like helicase ATP-binding domain-containing protein n=2 Tax=Fructilactobacillus lindneri TaxID=53444 RepID=A0A0R2JN88_9LACO|nr:RNA polymerase recycling motor HelD [Fructilactobacillus lindneri]ANZ57882.1 ATP-dependent DNA helicase [Fructilactobacillus lindneri]ANZ59151.1 ATP-dependent DNA helicase [Fructilactobacillus lindneri]KRN78654.1 hypothetical protein IV52_GL000930 [Fructilactobacillus lindneri DSM 20690 = JCM 11027]POG98202.1 ATP-dependent DNA helicase [Fructilactobacillus lindneri]POH01681.1 ATP-dependent DNA helicase [Fructilactobacillus lindneri]
MSESNEAMKQYEQKHLNFVRDQIGIAEQQTEKTIKRAKAGQKDLEKNFYNDVRIKTSTYAGQMDTGVSVRQQQQMLSQKQNRWQTATRDLETLQKLDQNAYFARVDLKEDGEQNPEKIYIGLASFTDPEHPDHYLIYDWRAPICSVYYDSGMGEMTYNAPMGKQTVDVTLKREIQIKDGVVETVFDTDEAVGDRVLLENLEKQSNTKMKSIVATIQQEQNAIIRDTSSDLLFVQGVAGSGKTAAVLQRVAYLLYRYRGNLNPGQLILFSPNQLFNDYINQVLPELGEQNMVQMTYYQFINRRVPHLEVETIQQRFDENLDIQQRNIADFKNSLDFFKLVTDYADHLNQSDIQFKNIMFQGKVFISKQEIKQIYYSFNENYNLRNRLAGTKEKLLKILNRHISSEMKKRWVEETVESLSKQQLQMLYAKYGEKIEDSDKEYNFLAKQIVTDAFKKVRVQIMKNRFFSINRQFVNLLRSVPKMADLSKWKISETEWQQSVEHTIERFKAGHISMTNVSIYLYLFDLVTGKHPDTEMRYLFVDEVQDYTPFQLAYLKWNFPRAKFTLLGDLNQAIFTHQYHHTIMDDLKQMFDPEKIKVINLLKSYRSTKQITDFTKYLIPDGGDIEAYARTGEKPVITVVDDETQGITALANQLQLNTEVKDTTAIIGKTLAECQDVYQKLQDRGIQATLIQTENQRLVNGVIVVPAYLAKGLEFDAVVMWDGSDTNYPDQNDDKLVYTICTRAMHRLDIISIGKPSPLFAKVPKDDYRQVKE